MMADFETWFIPGPGCPKPSTLHAVGEDSDSLDSWLQKSPSFWEHGPDDADKRRLIGISAPQLVAADGGSELVGFAERAATAKKTLHVAWIGEMPPPNCVESHVHQAVGKVPVKFTTAQEACGLFPLFQVVPRDGEKATLIVERQIDAGLLIPGCCRLDLGRKDLSGLIKQSLLTEWPDFKDCLLSPPIAQPPKNDDSWFHSDRIAFRRPLWERLIPHIEDLPPVLRLAAFSDHPWIQTLLMEGGKIHVDLSSFEVETLKIRWPATPIGRYSATILAETPGQDSTPPTNWQHQFVTRLRKRLKTDAEIWGWKSVKHAVSDVDLANAAQNVGDRWANGGGPDLSDEGFYFTRQNSPDENATLDGWIAWLNHNNLLPERGKDSLITFLTSLPQLNQPEIGPVLHELQQSLLRFDHRFYSDRAVSSLLDLIARPARLALLEAGYSAREPGPAWAGYLMHAIAHGDDWFTKASSYLSLVFRFAKEGRDLVILEPDRSKVRRVGFRRDSPYGRALRLLVPPGRIAPDWFTLDESRLDHDVLG